MLLGYNLVKLPIFQKFNCLDSLNVLGSRTVQRLLKHILQRHNKLINDLSRSSTAHLRSLGARKIIMTFFEFIWTLFGLQRRIVITLVYALRENLLLQLHIGQLFTRFYRFPFGKEGFNLAHLFW